MSQGKDEKRARTPWRDNIEAMTVAIVMAVVLKYFVIEAYKIPTGSMQPTLMGNTETGLFDRILVDKLSFRFRDPRRWEVVIFKYPLDRSKNFVKRVAGLPGEWFRILHGDVWTRPDETSEWTVARRPQRVLEEVLKELDPGDAAYWDVVESPGGDWQVEPRTIRARGTGRARFHTQRGAILDRYQDGYPAQILDELDLRQKPSSTNPVGDLRVDGEVRAFIGCEWVAVELDEGTRRYRFVIPGPAAPSDAVPSVAVLELGGGNGDEIVVTAVQADRPYRLPAASGIEFAAQNVDDLLRLEVDGDVLCELEVEPASDQRSAAWISASGEGADFEELQVYRDIYYLDQGVTGLRIPEERYFMLGDNTQDSSDSRAWKWWQLQVTDAETGDLELRGNNMSNAPNPLERNPHTFHPSTGGSWTRFVDEWGETWILPQDQVRADGVEPAPFVPRELITGRALLVFWPISVRHRLARLQWIR